LHCRHYDTLLATRCMVCNKRLISNVFVNIWMWKKWTTSHRRLQNQIATNSN